MWIDNQILARASEMVALEIFVPNETIIVLGRSNDPEVECRVAQCNSLNIPIVKRMGGGGTVVLYNGCIIISLGCWVKDRFENTYYFRQLNRAVLDCVAKGTQSKLDFKQQGISDLCIGENKFGGTSLFRSRNYLLYQASIIVNLDTQLIDQLLQHPSQEPDYRQGRKHENFLCDLSSHDENLNIPTVLSILKTEFEKSIKRNLAGRLILPINNQITYITKKSC